MGSLCLADYFVDLDDFTLGYFRFAIMMAELGLFSEVVKLERGWGYKLFSKQFGWTLVTHPTPN